VLPRTYRAPSRLDAETGVIVPCPEGRYGEDWTEEPVTPDGETYLRLGAVDLDDPEAILAFVNEFGVLGGSEAFDRLISVARGRILNVYWPRLNKDAEHQKKLDVLNEDHARTGSGDAWPSLALRFHYTETLDEFRFAARCLRDFTAAWRMYKEGTPASEVSWVSPDSSDRELLDAEAFPLLLLTELYPQAFLRHFSPHLNIYWRPPLPAGPLTNLPRRPAGVNADPQRQPTGGAGLYSICALELFNHIVENADYRLCANENCQQKLFVHQHGTAKKGQYRSKGVRFCSYACAHATAQRQYRRQLKAKAVKERGERQARSPRS
jgi:hypothetical protein